MTNKKINLSCLIVSAVLIAILNFPVHTLSQTNSKGNPKAELVVAMIDMSFNQRKVAEAFHKYVGPTYTQHNPRSPDGKEANIAALSAYVASVPELKYDIKRVFVDGDFVIVHAQMMSGPGDLGKAVVDILRLENGKIVEHWDVVQPVPEKPANDNTMF